mgnify:CR=1 FL=1
MNQACKMVLKIPFCEKHNSEKACNKKHNSYSDLAPIQKGSDQMSKILKNDEILQKYQGELQ